MWFVNFLTLFSCTSAAGSSKSGNGTPAWYINTSKAYPNQDYLAVRGNGNTEREARRDAAGELATLFTAQVNYDSTASFRYSESKNDSSKSLGVDQTVSVRSAQKISGLEYSELFRAEGLVYIVAYLDRHKVGKLYSERIAEGRDKIAELSSRARKIRPSDNNTEALLSGFILYDYSVDQAVRNQLLLEQLQIINKPMHERVARTIHYNSVQLAEERSKFSGPLSFAVNYNGNEDLTFLGENIAEQFTKLGFPRSQDESSALVLEVGLKLSDVEANNRYTNLAWDLKVSFTRRQNASGPQISLLEFSQNGRESGISRSRTITTLKRLLDEQIQKKFMSQVYAYFARLAGI